MFVPRDTKFVDIDDALLSNDDLRCLKSDHGFLPGDVSEQYMDHFLHIDV
jgi:hypothetical protein